MFGEAMQGITLWPYILISPDLDEYLYESTLQHEKIHFEQCKETLVIGFYFIYITNYILNIIRLKGNTNKAYREIIFEKEAYANMFNKDYISTRKKYAWIKNNIIKPF